MHCLLLELSHFAQVLLFHEPRSIARLHDAQATQPKNLMDPLAYSKQAYELNFRKNPTT